MTKTLATYDYKKWGHRYIDDLVRLGVPRNKVYSQLAGRMKVHQSEAHFSRNNSDPVLWKMVHILKMMLETKEREISHARRLKEMQSNPIYLEKKKAKAERKLKYKSYKQAVFSGKELLREVGRRNSMKVIPWYKRLFYFFLFK
jgi:hypothetical protein